MALWVFFIWLVAGFITGCITRQIFKRKSGFGMIGDGILGAVGGITGGYLVALTVIGSTLGGLILTIASAIACAMLVTWSAKFITQP
jgi:uncharacterized membrane protein YeaQ/YmgE (transglycosylase-associated protein family)